MFTSTSKNVHFNIPTFSHFDFPTFHCLVVFPAIASSESIKGCRTAGCKQRVRTFDPSTRSEIQVENIARIDSALTLLQNRHDFVTKWSHINALSNMFLPSCLPAAACAPVWSASSVQCRSAPSCPPSNGFRASPHTSFARATVPLLY